MTLDRPCFLRRPRHGFVSTVGVSTCLCLLILLLAPIPSSAQEEVNRIVLRVNDEILTLHHYEKRKSSEVSAILANPRLSPAERQEGLTQVGKNIMQQIFREMLLESFARQRGVVASEREVEDSLNLMMEQRGINNRADLEEALAASNMTLEDLRRNLRQELVLSGVVRREVTGKIEVGEDELRAYYRTHPEQFQVPERRSLQEVILLEASGVGEEELLRQAQKLRQELLDGGEVEETVGFYQDQGLSTGVIDLGMLEREELDEEIANAGFSMPKGEFSEPVMARGGYHILWATEVEDGYVLPFSEVEDMILARERQNRFGKALQQFMADLEQESYITENLPPDAVGYRSLAQDFLPEDELRDFRAPFQSLDEAGEALEEEAAAPLEEDEVAEEVAEEVGAGS